MDETQTVVRFEEPGNFLDNQLRSLVVPINKGFYIKTLVFWWGFFVNFEHISNLLLSFVLLTWIK